MQRIETLALFAACVLGQGCIEYAAERQSVDARELDGEQPSQPSDDGERPDDDTSLPFEIVGALPPGLPQSYIIGLRAGDDCSEGACREGLVCIDDTCSPEGNTQEGDWCILSAECAAGQCVNNVCVPADDGQIGDPCSSSVECESGLRCGVVSLSAQCVPEGEVAMGGECSDSNDCMSGLACVLASSAEDPICVPVPAAPPAVPAVWAGVSCEDPSSDQVRAFFEIPGAKDAREGDYFRLPFPNDVHTDASGRVDLTGFPTPGLNPIVGIDPIQPYVDAVDGTMGWGTNPTVTFRFSGPIDLDSFKGKGGIRWADITDPQNVPTAGISYRTTTARTNYVCHNALSVRRANGFPMQPGHTYAVWLATAGRSSEGTPIERAENFEAMLASAAPSNEVLAAAHRKFAPFRTYLDAQEIDTGDVLVATVISAGPTRKPMADLAAAVMQVDIPSASNWTHCSNGTRSPCPQAEGSRACGEDSAYEEYHALVELPIFQRGQAPYLREGGKIQTNEPVRSEQVCMALSVPKNQAMPDSGWPLVVFTHGTGGSFRSHLTNDSVAGKLSAAKTPDGTVAFAVLGYDQVQHGPRRGDSTESPDNLFFNFLNPDAAQGNPMQGAADAISIGRFAANLDIDGATSGKDPIKVDPERVVYFGHSQGAMHGSLGLPFSPDYKAAVLSGNGASLMHALLTKTEPVNIKAVVPLVINDGVNIDFQTGTYVGSLPSDDHHPVLSLVQQYIDPADPINFGPQMAREPVADLLPKHVFATYGEGDSFSPPLTMQMYALVANLLVVDADPSAGDAEPFGNVSDEFPLTKSFTKDGIDYTTAMRQYGAPDGRDGHFVVFDVPSASNDAARFLGMAASGLTPQIGE